MASFGNHRTQEQKLGFRSFFKKFYWTVVQWHILLWSQENKWGCACYMDFDHTYLEPVCCKLTKKCWLSLEILSTSPQLLKTVYITLRFSLEISSQHQPVLPYRNKAYAVMQRKVLIWVVASFKALHFELSRKWKFGKLYEKSVGLL